jgi:CheY-like chemotaxis protein
MKSILVIEDNSDIRDNIAEILELAGYRTVTAETESRELTGPLKKNLQLSFVIL